MWLLPKLPPITKNKPYYQPTISSWYNVTWHTRRMLSNGAHVYKNRYIGGFANLVRVGGTETITCFAHS